MGYLFGGAILSAGVCAYAAVELTRFLRGSEAILRGTLLVFVIVAGMVVSFFAVGGHAPYPRHSDTTLIPELALPPDDSRNATPTPSMSP